MELTPTAKPTSLRLLAQAVADVAEAQADLESKVANARRCGASWADVAALLGITRQAAQQKYGKTTTAADTGNTYDNVPLSDPAFDVLFKAPQVSSEVAPKAPATPKRRTEKDVLDSYAAHRARKDTMPDLCPGCGKRWHGQENWDGRPTAYQGCTETKNDHVWTADWPHYVDKPQPTRSK